MEDMSAIMYIVCIILALWTYALYSENKKQKQNFEFQRKKLAQLKVDIEESNKKQINEIQIKQNNYINLCKKNLETVQNEIIQCYPWTAQQVADIIAGMDDQMANYIALKKNPAIKASEQVKRVSIEKKAIQRQCKQLEYQLNFIKSTFPWMEDFMEVDPKEAYLIAKRDSEVEEEEESYERYKNWLSPKEYADLPTTKKYQLALDRYMKQPRSDWEAGILYERFIGYKYESMGYKVDYYGATKKLEDMGRDLIATKDSDVLIIQCKRRRKEKQIHENVVFQTYGTSVLYQTEHPEKTVKAIICTTTELSETARRGADYLGVKYKENYDLGQYPLIKCNISKEGEKIYHLPFDQQYDRVRISGKEGACYVATVQEAEKMGFRRAKRWHPDQ